MNVLPRCFSSRGAPSAWLRALTAALSFHVVGAKTYDVIHESHVEQPQLAERLIHE